ncbi:MAG: bifunctional folylpolyglutamate synthase/dihydrofolate synthase [Desulfobacteraceae bacterium]|nr:bifunctional folylpolyglutamate synthase/dihydrofolate synthase [Desulfobacteraceae bacterium]
MSTSSYSNCLKSLFSLRRFGIKLELDTIRHILTALGNPQCSYRCIHIAGTNGKGSVAATLATIIRAAGYRVGLYTSPHLISFNERICINNRHIDNEDVVATFEAVKSVHHGDREPTYFEFATAMALYQFAKEQVDWAIIETGMGGRYDATNVITPILSVITNISIEHKSYLGNTINEISMEKGGIIKDDTPVITGVHQKSAIDTIGAIAAEKNAPIYRLGKDFKVRKTKDGAFNYSGMFNKWSRLRSSLIGTHQIENAALAMAACEILNRYHILLPLETIKSGLQTTHWPGRLEIVSSNPLVILDGAHNLMAARNLGRYLFEKLSSKRKTLIVGILDDKPYTTMIKDLAAPCDRVIVTQPKIDRALPAEILLDTVKPLVSDVTIIRDVGEAVLDTIQSASPTDAICVAGSLYVVGEAKAALQNRLDIAH